MILSVVRRLFRPRKRDGSTISYTYDALNRVASKVIPARADLTSAQTRSVYYGYDADGHQLYARFDGPAGAEGITNTYDGFGELASSTSTMGGSTIPLSYLYDADGNRTRITHPDGASFTYTYDGLDRFSGLYEGPTTASALQTFAYGTNGLLSVRADVGVQAVDYEWDNLGRLTRQIEGFTDTASNVTNDRTYNPASQVASETRSNNAYDWTGAVTVNRNYTVNGLNQYTAAGPASFTYDANGNLTGDGSWAYTYDVENRLVHAVASGKDITLTYDPLGRLWKLSGTGIAETGFVYDGDALAGEYVPSTGAILDRYIHGANAGADDPLVWYTGSAVGSSNRRNLHADNLGSIIATSDGSGAMASINSYDEYGIPAAANTGRFQYTGQAYIPELGLYYYKARIYSPTLGRFLQTDPVGYDDQINLYGYVADDPVNRTDPSGSQAIAAAPFCFGPQALACGAVVGAGAAATACVASPACRQVASRLSTSIIDAIRTAISLTKSVRDDPQKTITVYRFHGGTSPKKGEHWTTDAPSSFKTKADARNRLALDPKWGNTLEASGDGACRS